MKAIVFDFGNVVGFFDHRRATDRLAAHSDLSSEQILAALMGGQLEDDYESGRLSSDEYLRHVRELCKFRCPDEELASVYGDIFWPNPDVCELLPLLKPRYTLLLGSNTSELHARKFREQFADVLRHFDALVLSYEIGTRKPRPGFFEHCQRLAGCRADECLFIDDLPANVAGARACGWHGLVYRRGDDLRGQLAALGVRFGQEQPAAGTVALPGTDRFGTVAPGTTEPRGGG